MSFVAAGTLFLCTPIAVWDGDGPVWCAEGPKLRLAGIAAKEIGEKCQHGQPCPRASAESAKAALVDLLGGPRGKRPEGHVVVRYPALRCVSRGDAHHGRTAAYCTLADGRNLSCAMLATGTVLRWRKFAKGLRCPSVKRIGYSQAMPSLSRSSPGR